MICYIRLRHRNTTSKATSQSLLIKSMKGMCVRVYSSCMFMCPYTWRKIHNCFPCENGVRKNKVRFELGWKFLILRIRGWRSKLKRYTQFWPKPNPYTYYPKKKQDTKDHWFITKHLGSVSSIFNRFSF